MRDLSTLEYHPTMEKLVSAICQTTMNSNKKMYRMMLCYYMCKMAATMRVQIATKIRNNIPINSYVINLATSGQNKTYSTVIIEKMLLEPFRKIFIDQTLPLIAEEQLAKIATKRAYIQNEDPDTILKSVTDEYKALGTMMFSFSEGTTPAIKQMRHKLIMTGAGAVNLEIDEIGMNFLPNTDALGTFLELYDIGETKDKITKNSKDNVRNEELRGTTPSNLLAFGTPSKLLDGGKTEEAFYAFLEMGAARRCLFGYTKSSAKPTTLTASEIYDIQTDPAMGKYLKDIAGEFSKLANIVNCNKVITLSKAVCLEMIEYNEYCKNLAGQMGEHQDMAKAEMEHRYFKALKLAGAYAFVDGHSEITADNLYAAIRIAEESGEAFSELLNRDRPYAKLAKYIASVPDEVTHVDLVEDLPFYKGSSSQKTDLMNQAIAWGHKNHIIIKTSMTDGIEFIKGTTLTKTDLNKLTVAHSNDISDGYKNDQAPFDKLHLLVLKKNYHWINHWTTTGHRDGDHMIPGFNLVVLDVDEGVKISEACALLEDYRFMIYTTKRHTPATHRFRIILPLNYEMAMTGEEYRAFMKNINEWLPFKVDDQTFQRSRKWLSNPGQHYYSKGEELLDARMFIPKTKKNDERKQSMQTYANLSILERWFVQNSHKDENRNNQLHRYARVLVDMGHDFTDVRTKVLGLNSGLIDKIDEGEIDRTVMVTVSKAIGLRAAKQAA